VYTVTKVNPEKGEYYIVLDDAFEGTWVLPKEISKHIEYVNKEDAVSKDKVELNGISVGDVVSVNTEGGLHVWTADVMEVFPNQSKVTVKPITGNFTKTVPIEQVHLMTL
jgi:hypothetical protein